MMKNLNGKTHVAIACGGTGGHLFPGLAIGEQLLQRDCSVTLLVSPKDVDQQAVRSATGMEVETLPAVALSSGGRLAFALGFLKSYLAARKLFKKNPPHAVLAMGGFTSAPPILAAKSFGAPTFLHDSNTIPGRANRLLSWTISHAFVGFPESAKRLNTKNVTVTGTPVRPKFKPGDVEARREALGLDPKRPVLLVVGGSQGARGINEIVLGVVPMLATLLPDLQYFHITGPKDADEIRAAYAGYKLKAVVHPFFADMDVALGASTIAISRSGASSLAEFAAMQLPAILIPYPTATDNHQFYNAQAYESTGAARLLLERSVVPELLAPSIVDLVENASTRETMRHALAQWRAPNAAESIAEHMLTAISRKWPQRYQRPVNTRPSTVHSSAIP